ncbi:uncharacterized protein LOC143052673 [Mytilus galloprovincialis]|uniref:uncharacterized protein LOC143052673 n=1 Tax=Mytilus galloprovincialis TaxID=29158 RepID=UPI003F7BD0E1
MTVLLDEMSKAAESLRSSTSTVPYRAERPKSGNPGRPKVSITREELQFMYQSNFTGAQMAEHFGCCRKVIYTKLKEHGLSMENRFSNLTEQDLDEEVRELKESHPNAGSQMIQGYLRADGQVIQRQRVRASLRRVDPDGTSERWSAAVHRRVYSVATPNTLWHMDGHMKLIRWGFVTHGCIDGYSRYITFLHCGTNNTASSVLEQFVKACTTLGVPSRVRSDHGAENIKVALFMNLIRGRSSHITGRSVHNQRIERVWRDMHKEVTSVFKKEFYDMEDSLEVQLDPSNNIHIWALQYVYIPILKDELDKFQRGWNAHGLRTAHQKSPRQLWVSGMLNNMGSLHTAPSEVFGRSLSLEERLENGLAQFGVSLADLEVEILENTNQQQVQLTAEQKTNLDTELERCVLRREKFVKCLSLLTSFGYSPYT